MVRLPKRKILPIKEQIADVMKFTKEHGIHNEDLQFGLERITQKDVTPHKDGTT